MRKVLYLIGLSIVITSCYRKQQTNNANSESKVNNDLVYENKNLTTGKEYFSKQEEFEKFIYSKRWVDLADETPCHEYARSITIKDGYFHEYNGVEPSKCKIENVKQLDSKTLEITIEENCNYGNVFKVEILDYDRSLVKWTIFKGQIFNAKPYDIVCNGSDNYKEDDITSKESSFTKKWEGFYKFSDAKEDEDWREGKHYDLYISLDSVNLKSYGYQYVRCVKSYAIEKEDCLFIYSQESDEELLLKLIIKDNEYIATSLIDRKGEFRVLKKN
ncbi:conserved hypothetical protein [Tenacibaculum maritimum]|uniref:hypothetical protein n=1 Tax=Tenacibaculum maritimum TaxID=107401 RepID=UPI0012E4B107|nr:hypothetical protein [Tenacibaculum maritimum]CAA0149755.1 conserved hypothetical protein [Tenacibaculum maritimum]